MTTTITPEQARAELRRREALRELQRRGISQSRWAKDPLVGQEAVMAKWENDPIVQPRSAPWENDPVVGASPAKDTWLGEIGRGLARVGRQIAATGPGQLGFAMEAGIDVPGGWYIKTPAIEKGQRETARKLRKTAQDIYRSADAPELAPRKGGVAGFVVNTGASALGYMAGATASSLALGPAGPLLFGTATGGEMMYQEAKKQGATEGQANVERLIFGPIYGAIEGLQVRGVLKPGKNGVRLIADAVRRRAYKELARTGGKIAADHLLDAAWEGLEEGLQEVTQIGAATVHGEMPKREDLKRIGMAAVGGFTAGGLLRGGKSLGKAVMDLPGAVVEQQNKALDERVAVEPQAPPAAEVPAAAEEGVKQAIRVYVPNESGEMSFEGQNFAVDADASQVMASELDDENLEMALVELPDKTIVARMDAAETGTGSGTRALEQLKRRASNTGKPIELDVAADNERAIRLYARQGFVETGRIGDRIVMRYTPDAALAAPGESATMAGGRPVSFADAELTAEIYRLQQERIRARGAEQKADLSAKIEDLIEQRKALRAAAPERTADLPVAETVTPVQGKQPWEMTRVEFTRNSRVEGPRVWLGNTVVFTRAMTDRAADPRMAHQAVVQQALAEGKPVPRHVLEEYKGEPWAAVSEVAAVPGEPVTPGKAKLTPTPRRGLELFILKTRRKAGLTDDQYRDALEKAVGKRSLKDNLSMDELRTAAAYFKQNYGDKLTGTPVSVVGQTTTMEAVVDEALQSAAKLAPQKRILREKVKLGSGGGFGVALKKAGRFMFGDLNTAPYYSAKVLDGGNESGIFSRVLDQNIQRGNAVRAKLVTTLNRVGRAAREAAGITPEDLASMSRAVNPSFKIQERIAPKTETIPVEIGGRTWPFTWGRLLNFYGQTSQVDPKTGESIGRAYVRQYGIRVEGQFTGPMSDAEIDHLRSLVENNPKAMAELDIEWKTVGPLRARAVNEVSRQTEGRDIATIPDWYHLEISRARRVPGKTVEVETKGSESESVELALDDGAKNFRIDLIENQNILKARRGGGRGPLVIRDHYEVINAVNHAVAEYYGFTLPFRTARTLLNHPDVQRELDAKGYRDTRELLTELFSRIQGSERGAGGEIGPFKELRANFYRAVINFSPHVTVPQPTSVLNYGAYADAKYVAQAATRMFSPKEMKEMLAHSPIAHERFHGGFGTMELGEAMESDAVLQAMTGRSSHIDKPAILARVTDLVPLNGGWVAAKAEFRDAKAGEMSPEGMSARWWKGKDLSGVQEGSEAWMGVVRDRAHYLWQRSQQTWESPNRSWLSGHPNQALRSLWFFRTYHEKIVGMWNDALLDLKMGKSTKAEFAKRVSYPVASYMAEAVVRSVLLAAIFGDVRDRDDYMLALITSPLSAFPVFGAVMQAAIMSFAKAAEDKKQRYRNWELIDSPMLDMVNETAEASILVAQAVGEWVEGDEQEAEEAMYRAMYRLMRPVGMGGFGVPVHNIEKFYRGRLAPPEPPKATHRRAPRRYLRRRPE